MPPNNRYVAHQLGDMYHNLWGVMDLADSTLLRVWRGRKRTHRIWHATQIDAESLAALMSKPAPAQLGHVTVVGDFDPPTRENAKQWAISQAKARTRSRSSRPAVPFLECPTCHTMTKTPEHCPPP